ncbi:Zinc finger transcription factor ace1 [Fusarium oxysporum f. sp. albedinis]|nr:Zinc finger transcription factor ace1 [Fusarium oxysporum f. sp. albedinis]
MHIPSHSCTHSSRHARQLCLSNKFSHFHRYHWIKARLRELLNLMPDQTNSFNSFPLPSPMHALPFPFPHRPTVQVKKEYIVKRTRVQPRLLKVCLLSERK